MKNIHKTEKHTDESIILDLEKKIEELTKELESCKESGLRSLADYKNLSTRLEDEKRKIFEFANEGIMRELVDIISEAEIAASHTEDAGLKQIYEKLIKILNRNGLTEVKIVENETVFEPSLHEAIDTKDGLENVILKVYRKGYLLNSKVLQTALVCVGRDLKN